MPGRVFVIFLTVLIGFSIPVALAAAAEEGGRKVLYWYDPMVPGQKFDKPGKSPYMDMDLVPFYADEAPQKNASGESPSSAVQIDARYRQALGVKIAPARMENFGKSVQAPGIVAPETRLEHVVAVRSAGWIVDLKTDAEGDTVKKGDLLFTCYSPALMTAQTDFLSGQQGERGEHRLRFYGMDDKAIAELKAQGKFMESTPFYAPEDGTVTRLNVRKGAYVKEGDAVLTLQDFSRVWVMAQVPVGDLQFVSAETPATVSVNETGRTFRTSAEYIFPVADGESRTGMVRLALDNPDQDLKTGSLVTVAFETGGKARLAVPEQAVLYGKDGARVIEATGKGYFRPVTVETGITAHGMTEILSGLKEGQNVVTSGQFMIDAESSLRGGTEDMENGTEENTKSTDMKAMDMGGHHAHEH